MDPVFVPEDYWPIAVQSVVALGFVTVTDVPHPFYGREEEKDQGPA